MHEIHRVNARPHRWAGRLDPLRRWAVVAGLALLACGEPSGSKGTIDASDALPTLVEVPVPVAAHAPGSVEGTIVAGPDGGWLYAPADLGASALVMVDSSGTRRTALGAYGAGPGEMLASFPLWLDDTIAIGHDLATRRIIVWSREGRVKREFRAGEPVVPFARGPGNSLLGSRFRGEIEVPVLIDLGSGAVRDLLAPTDSMLRRLFRDEASVSARLANLPAIGRWRDGVVVGNGLTYELVLWNRDGTLAGQLARDLPPVLMGPEAVERELQSLGRSPMIRSQERLDRIRAELEATPVRRFTHVGAPRTDGRGRLWVVVKEGDDVAADVFTAERFLGRLPLDCPGHGGRWDLNDDWLMLVCQPDDPASELDAVVRRYRIVEP